MTAGSVTPNGATTPVAAEDAATGIGVLAGTSIAFLECSIDNPSNPGVSLEDEDIVEFVLIFERG